MDRSDKKSGVSRNLYGRVFRVGLGVGTGDAKIDVSYIIFMIRAQSKDILDTVQHSGQKGRYTVLVLPIKARQVSIEPVSC